MRAAMEFVDYALPRIEDVRALTGLNDPDATLDYYLKIGPGVVVLKMGEAGAYLATPDARAMIPAFAAATVDATGAGDAFCGSFLARILAGDSPEPAARYAAVATALKCTGYGAVAPILTPARVLEAMRRMPD
jgi:2-dehydro-3-deoxygluconokinase